MLTEYIIFERSISDDSFLKFGGEDNARVTRIVREGHVLRVIALFQPPAHLFVLVQVRPQHSVFGMYGTGDQFTLETNVLLPVA